MIGEIDVAFVEKYDIKVRERNSLRQQIESHIEDVFQTLNSQLVLADFYTWDNNFRYAHDCVAFMVHVGIMSKRDSEKYYEKLKDLQKERIYLRM